MPTLKVTNRDAAEKLAQTFRAGKVAIFPTDTVYGLGCILEEKALRKIFKIKNRPPDKPLPLLIADLDEALSLAYFSPAAREAATKFWPGATTLVLNSRKELPSWVYRNGKVALRIPNHPFLREVIRRLGQNIVGTSANLSGEEPAGSVAEISAKILAEVDLVIDGGDIPGKASVVYDYTGPKPVIIRT
ncbi:MAG: L-threonylcarbamoyladenylate synthase [Candidatus Omnitrophica bacterium]|nr:L-threonylcarbamoyladenylate synthase [Candidatus Omnitrophota bacterium]